MKPQQQQFGQGINGTPKQECPQTSADEPIIGYRHSYVDADVDAENPTELQKAVAELSTAVHVALGDVRTLINAISPVLREEPNKNQEKDPDVPRPIVCELTERLATIYGVAIAISREVGEARCRLSL
jgi:hypothetical protein